MVVEVVAEAITSCERQHVRCRSHVAGRSVSCMYVVQLVEEATNIPARARDVCLLKVLHRNMKSVEKTLWGTA